MASDTYSLRAGPAEKEVERLNAGHDLISRVTGSLLPPQISINPNKPIRVADIATGTGAWLVQLRERLPVSSVLDGFDITNAQFPPQDTLPDTVKLNVHDMREPFPQDFLGSYDIVHVRLIMYALKGDEWAKTVKNLVTLLKPGGYLISEDTSYTEWLAIPASVAHCRFLQIDMAFSGKAGRDLM
ncbi:hypothetical protein AOQ84DRAFT_326187 [Glonium stellatum]|uniref:Methyltransferase domain-containing protein n=1 Tax=Glonium stellatum TaxID=574774 RepID=A0A8E2ER49_9PEZI|nr:hypothetical protein AOQ84DRAFT_326187 [Glonium stellatum]